MKGDGVVLAREEGDERTRLVEGEASERGGLDGGGEGAAVQRGRCVKEET